MKSIPGQGPASGSSGCTKSVRVDRIPRVRLWRGGTHRERYISALATSGVPKPAEWRHYACAR
eukprot:scaffold20442_cov33-Prasinocladus_malaysianus.AAC.1